VDANVESSFWVVQKFLRVVVIQTLSFKIAQDVLQELTRD